uniref:TnsA endonuclease N-terminal domain-containing protein n=1 Tax=Ruegeria arenilitoris TaxID=1173585 RepID=UPI00147F5B05|nr:TnsA endonuclease N-terminal domain-containing protein [Ruegeria arenilitoris]
MKKDPKSHPTSRIVRKAGQKKRANYVSAPKCAGYIQLESTLEATTAFALALDPRVASFRPQPCTYDLLSGRSYAKKENLIDEFVGKRYRPKPYTPDFLVRMRDGRAAFVETKAERWVNEDLHRDFLPKFFKSVGHHWTLITDETLTEIVAHNVRTLKAVIDRPPTKKTLEVLAEVPTESVRLGQLISEFDLGSDELLCAILSGFLAVDLFSRRLGPASFASLNPTPKTNHLEIIEL